MNKVVGLTSATYRNNIFLENFGRMYPKPEINVVYNDTQFIKKYTLKRKLWKISNNCNTLKRMLPEDTTHILFMEDDVETPINILELLMDTFNKIPDADCVTTATVCRFLNVPMLWDFEIDENKKVRLLTYADIKPRIKKKGVQPIGATSLNCFLIKREVFDKLIFRGNDEHDKFTIDVMFFFTLWALKYKTYINLNVPTLHDYTHLYKGKFVDMERDAVINKIRTERIEVE